MRENSLNPTFHSSVEYSMTEMGEDLKPVLEKLRDWAKNWAC
ncbi:MAG: winged helix-turn-helix transcriptional regulator [Candidatus Thorarchaeota archaeon]